MKTIYVPYYELLRINRMLFAVTDDNWFTIGELFVLNEDCAFVFYN